MLIVDDESSEITTEVSDLSDTSLDEMAARRDTMDATVDRMLPAGLPVAAFNSSL
ncbi:hypothetical protein [Microbispora sp. H10830]|uniref:hypothetical protein n=1 Tax=Microbispora sp. H10830 TaxID=2729109 RepID=UPI001603D5EF|nr:hypothetical protein [Microbispora sp. H10830]